MDGGQVNRTTLNITSGGDGAARGKPCRKKGMICRRVSWRRWVYAETCMEQGNSSGEIQGHLLLILDVHLNHLQSVETQGPDSQDLGVGVAKSLPYCTPSPRDSNG